MRAFRNATVVFAAAALLAAAWATHAAASTIPVFQYQFPASGSSLVPSPAVVTDVSSAGHNGKAFGMSGTGLSNDVPSGMTGKSLDFTATNTGDVVVTDAHKLLNNAGVLANGGFTFDVYFKQRTTPLGSAPPYVGQILMDGGVDGFQTLGDGTLTWNFWNGLDHSVSLGSITNGQWHHAEAVFNTTGYSIDGNGDLQGSLKLYLDGVLKADQVATHYKATVDLDRGLSMGAQPSGAIYCNFDGLVYNPAVYLGVGVVPEPSTLALLATGLVSLLAYAWRRRKCVPS